MKSTILLALSSLGAGRFIERVLPDWVWDRRFVGTLAGLLAVIVLMIVTPE